MRSFKKKIYWSSVEFLYEKKSVDYGKLEGGFVYVFIKSSDAAEALDKIKKAFKEKYLNPIDIDYISPYDPELEWEHEEDQKKYLKLYDFAFHSGLVEFDDFYSYESHIETDS